MLVLALGVRRVDGRQGFPELQFSYLATMLVPSAEHASSAIISWALLHFLGHMPC